MRLGKRRTAFANFIVALDVGETWRFPSSDHFALTTFIQNVNAKLIKSYPDLYGRKFRVILSSSINSSFVLRIK